MIIKGMGYLGVTVPDLAEWEDYGTRLVGAQVVEKDSDSLKLRLDDRFSRINVHQADERAVASHLRPMRRPRNSDLWRRLSPKQRQQAIHLQRTFSSAARIISLEP